MVVIWNASVTVRFQILMLNSC